MVAGKNERLKKIRMTNGDFSGFHHEDTKDAEIDPKKLRFI